MRQKDPRTENKGGNGKQDGIETPQKSIFRLILVYHYYSKPLLGILILGIGYKTGLWYFDISFPPIIMKPCPLCVCKYFQDISPPSHPPSVAHVTGIHVTGIQLYSASLLPLFLLLKPPSPFPSHSSPSFCQCLACGSLHHSRSWESLLLPLLFLCLPSTPCLLASTSPPLLFWPMLWERLRAPSVRHRVSLEVTQK